MSQNIQSIICLCGNDGTGKSSLINTFKQLYPSYAVIQRSAKQINKSLQGLRMEIKHIDFLTCRYAFQKQRYDFQPSRFVKIQQRQVQVHWILLDLDPQTIFKRISNRIQMGIFESKKCVEYFSYVYLQLAAFYGMTVIDVHPTPKAITTQIVNMIQSGATSQIASLDVKNMSIEKIMASKLQNLIEKELTIAKTNRIIKEYLQPQILLSKWQKQFYQPELNNLLYQKNQINLQLATRLAAKWIATHSTFNYQDKKLTLKYSLGQQVQVINLQSPIFQFYVEGESKQIYQVRSKIPQVQNYFDGKVWIILKSTIYSHTNQHTGQIQNLAKVRAVGSNLFLQMLRRNNLQHAYIAINHQGVIYSRKMQTNSIEVVFKRQFVGTDKHSYFGLNLQPSIITENKYNNGIYVRFDWRNPNHFLLNFQNVILNSNSYYYIIQKYVGKEKFFNIFLKKQKVKPMGDKCITEDLIANYIDTQKIKKSVLSLYCAFSYYCKQVNLHIVDGCFMFNRDGSVVWSEINPDCMRVKYIQNTNKREDYDKDIWRAGGSSSKELIMKKWGLFNRLFIDYFSQNRFHQTQLLDMPPHHYSLSQSAQGLLNDQKITWTKQYKNILFQLSSKTQKVKEVISTIDINDGKPSLVKSSILSQHHSGNSLTNAFNYLKVMPKVVLVDLDAAMGKQTNNRKQIKNLTIGSSNNVFGVGGGIRTIQAVNHYLFTLCIPKIILSSNLDLLKQLPAEIIEQRIMVQLSINQNNDILTHGRTINTGIKLIEKMFELVNLGVKIISITFNHKQGHLTGIPRKQFRDIMFQIPGPIKKVIVAGGITSLDDLDFIWGFPKAVPQLGSAIWKNKISLCDIITRIINFNEDGLIPSIISSSTGKILGQVHLNKQALQKSIETRQLYRFSRKLNRLIKKGEQSGNIQQIESLSLDCDNDCLKIVVKESNKPFCHNLTQSCFDVALPNKIETIEALQKHIQSKQYTGSGYSKKMQQNEHLAACKVLEQSRQLLSTKDRHVQQGADLIAHLLMYFNAKSIPLSAFMQELNFRANKQKIIKNIKSVQPVIANQPQSVEYIGVMGGKHFEKIDKAAQQLFGLRMIRPKNRSLKVQFVIENQQKYDQFFKDIKLIPIGIKSKDMGVMLEKKKVKWCFNYSIMMENYLKIWKELTYYPIQGIKLAVLKKKHKKVNPITWTQQSKGKIITQYPTSMINYLHCLGISEANYSIITVSGGTQGFLQMPQFDYCDAIIQSGKTVEDNNLQIVKVICDTIYGTLYTLE